MRGVRGLQRLETDMPVDRLKGQRAWRTLTRDNSSVFFVDMLRDAEEYTTNSSSAGSRDATIVLACDDMLAMMCRESMRKKDALKVCCEKKEYAGREEGCDGGRVEGGRTMVGSSS